MAQPGAPQQQHGLVAGNGSSHDFLTSRDSGSFGEHGPTPASSAGERLPFTSSSAGSWGNKAPAFSGSSNPYLMSANAANAQAYNMNSRLPNSGLPMRSFMGASVADPFNRERDHFAYSGMSEGLSRSIKYENRSADNESWNLRQGAVSSVPQNVSFNDVSDPYPVVLKQSSSEANSPTFPLQDEEANTAMPFRNDAYGHGALAPQRNSGAFGLQMGSFAHYPWSGLGGLNQTVYPMQPNRHDQGFGNIFLQAPSGLGLTARAGWESRAVEQVAEEQPKSSQQDTPSSSRPLDEQQKLDTENAILKKGKAEGLTYKDIQVQIQSKTGRSIIESTLRGRWRSMSKRRQERVRKPVWTPNDVRLLGEAVKQQFDGLDDNTRTSSADTRLTKVSWKRVSEYISDNGGSYTFGNATCKKKWVEVHRHSQGR